MRYWRINTLCACLDLGEKKDVSETYLNKKKYSGRRGFELAESWTTAIGLSSPSLVLLVFWPFLFPFSCYLHILLQYWGSLRCNLRGHQVLPPCHWHHETFFFSFSHLPTFRYFGAWIRSWHSANIFLQSIGWLATANTPVHWMSTMKSTLRNLCH